MTGNLRIALDIDGVLADSMTPWAKRYNKMYSRHLTTSQMGTWNFWSELGLTKRQFQEIFTEVWRDWKHIPCTEASLSEKVLKLSQCGQVDVVTGRTEDTEEYAKEWLKLQKVQYGRMILIPSNSLKLDSGHSIYVDDSPIIASEASVVKRKVLLYDQPWNRRSSENQYVNRVKSLDGAARVLDSMSSQESPC